MVETDLMFLLEELRRKARGKDTPLPTVLIILYIYEVMRKKHTIGVVGFDLREHSADPHVS